MIFIASIIPKLKWFLFISIISLLINVSACCVALLNNEQNLSEYTIFSDEEIETVEVKDKTNITTSTFAVAVTTSFVPFVDLINLAFLGLDIVTNIILGIIIIIFGALKTLLIAEMILGHIPFLDV